MAELKQGHPLVWTWRAAHWWLFAAAMELLLALPMALAYHQWLSSTIAQRFEPGDLFANLSTNFRFDQRSSLEQLGEHNASMGAVMALLAMLLGMFIAGGWASLSFGRPRGWRAAAAGGARFFTRYLRVWLGTLLLLALWSWVMFDTPWKSWVLGGLCGLPSADYERMESFTSEWSAVGVRLAQMTIYALGIVLLMVVADYARLRVAWRDARCVTFEFLGAGWLVLRHPWRALAPLAGVGALELGVIALAGYAARNIEAAIGINQGNWVSVASLATISALLVALRCYCRGARYALAARVVVRQVEPMAKPFPWR